MCVEDHAAAATRRVLYLQIASNGCERDACRAERLLLRALERQWPPARLERLLRRLLDRVNPADPGTETMP